MHLLYMLLIIMVYIGICFVYAEKLFGQSTVVVSLTLKCIKYFTDVHA